MAGLLEKQTSPDLLAESTPFLHGENSSSGARQLIPRQTKFLAMVFNWRYSCFHALAFILYSSLFSIIMYNAAQSHGQVVWCAYFIFGLLSPFTLVLFMLTNDACSAGLEGSGVGSQNHGRHAPWQHIYRTSNTPDRCRLGEFNARYVNLSKVAGSLRQLLSHGPRLSTYFSTLLGMNIKLSSSDMSQLGYSSLAMRDGSGYLASLGVYHQLHCVVCS